MIYIMPYIVRNNYIKDDLPDVLSVCLIYSFNLIINRIEDEKSELCYCQSIWIDISLLADEFDYTQ